MRDEKKQQKEALKEEMLRLGNLQRECKEEKIPVYITFDGYDGAGKGVQIGRLMQALDPRGFDVYTGDKDTEEEALRPFLWRFAVHAPAEGRITIYDAKNILSSSAYELFKKNLTASELTRMVRELKSGKPQKNEFTQAPVMIP